MHLFDYLITNQCKLNDLSVAWPYDATTNLFDVTKGPQPLVGMLGEYWDYDYPSAAKWSNTNNGTLKGGRYVLVRGYLSATAAFLVGRPLYWYDKSKWMVTPDAVAGAIFAGICLNVPDAKSDMFVIQTLGEANVIFAASFTKTTPAINDLCVLVIGSGVATLDVLADATNVTWGTANDIAARCAVAPTANQKNLVHLMSFPAQQMFTRGISG